MIDTGDLVYSGDHLRATLFNGISDRLAITFSFREVGRTTFAPVNPSSNMANNGFAQLAITSRLNDWFINPDTRHIEDVLRKLTPHYKAVHLLGFSMGGYGAFRFAAAANATYVTAISPQFSIHPDVVPMDRRYRKEADGFARQLGDLTRVQHHNLEGVVMVDPFRPMDLMHANMLTEVFPRVRIARLPFGGHPATALLARAGKSGIVQQMALRSPPAPEPLIAQHRAARHSDADYHAALAEKLLTR